MLQIVPNYDAAPISTGDMSNPIVLVADGNKGEAVVQRVFLHNTESSKYYTQITLRTASIPPGWSVKLLVQKNRPTEAEWAKVESGNEAAVSDIGGPAAADLGYHPVWIRLQVPPGTSPQTVLSARLQASFTEWSR